MTVTPIYIPTMKQHMKDRLRGVNFPTKSHDQKHGPKTIVYTSVKTLNTTAGTKLRLPRGGEVTRIVATAQGAPSGADMTVDYLIDGISVLDNYITIPNGDTISAPSTINNPEFNEDSVHQVQVITVSSATGPMVVTIEYMEEY